MKKNHTLSLRIAGVICLMIFLYPFQQSEGQFRGNDSSYFPIRVGNEWRYVSQSSSDTERISDTARIHGQLYYALSIGGLSRDWLRKSNDSVYVLEDTTDSTESLLYNFGANVGDSWELPSQYSCTYGVKIKLTSKTDTVITPAGTFTNCYVFGHQPGCMDGGMNGSWFAKGVGEVRWWMESFAGLIDFRLASYMLVTSVGSPARKFVTDSYDMLHNYPNPFNPSTVIGYQIPAKSFVTLKVIDVLGRDVTVLVDKEQQAGSYQAMWNAAGFPSGIYFAILRAQAYSSVRKLVLLK
jgi:hypothetical protein